jgi:hypothetical protein
LPKAWDKHAKTATLHVLPSPTCSTGAEICLVLDEAARRAGRAPKYTVSDQGTEFGEDYLDWCDDHDVCARFGAVGRHGSIAVEERFILTLKEEGLAHEMVSLQHSGISKKTNPRPETSSARRFDLVLRVQISLFSVGECRWTTTLDIRLKSAQSRHDLAIPMHFYPEIQMLFFAKLPQQLVKLSIYFVPPGGQTSPAFSVRTSRKPIPRPLGSTGNLFAALSISGTPLAAPPLSTTEFDGLGGCIGSDTGPVKSSVAQLE